jgi:hypothetical protein
MLIRAGALETIDFTHLQFPLLRGREDFKTRPVPDRWRFDASSVPPAISAPIWCGGIVV